MLGNIYIVGQHLANGANNRVLTATSAYGMNGESNLTFDGTQLSVTGSGTDVLKIESTDAGAQGVNLILQHSPGATNMADNDVISLIQFNGKDDSNNNTTYSSIRAIATDVSNNSESGDITFHTRNAGSFGERLRIKSDGTIYAVTQTKRFGIGQDPDATTMGATSGTWQVPEVDGQTIGSELRLGDINTNSTAVIRLASYGSGDNGTGGGAIMFTNTRNGSASAHSDIAAIKGARESLGKGYLRFFTADSGANTERLRITSDGYLIKAAGRAAAFNVRGTNMARTDAGGYICTFDDDSSTGCFDSGGNFNTSTYKFIAPVTGTYYFFTNIRLDAYSVGYIRTAFLSTNYGSGSSYWSIPETGHVISYPTNSSGIMQVSTSTVVQLDKDDELYVYQDPQNDTSYTVYLNESSFGGYLIG